MVAGVVDLKIRSSLRVPVQARNFQWTTDRAAERVLRECRLRDRHVWTKLIRSAVERRSAERIGSRTLIGALAARAAAAEREPATPDRPAEAWAARSTGA